MWKGSISFGLVNVPAGVYLATEDREFSFNQLCANTHNADTVLLGRNYADTVRRLSCSSAWIHRVSNMEVWVHTVDSLLEYIANPTAS